MKKNLSSAAFLGRHKMQHSFGTFTGNYSHELAQKQIQEIRTADKLIAYAQELMSI